MDDEMTKKNYHFLFFWILGGLFLLIIMFAFYLRYDSNNPDAHKTITRNGIMYLGQGWGQSEREKLSYTSFGSRIINYEWFLVLENARDENLFRQNDNLARLGFLIEPAHK